MRVREGLGGSRRVWEVPERSERFQKGLGGSSWVQKVQKSSRRFKKILEGLRRSMRVKGYRTA